MLGLIGPRAHVCHEICTLTCFPAEVGVVENLITLTKVQIHLIA